MTVLLAALLLAAHPHPSSREAPSPLSRPERETVRAASGEDEGERETPDGVARRYGLAGELLVGKGGRVLLDRGYGTISPEGGPPHRAGGRWRLASITKQVTAALIVRGQRAEGRSLDDRLTDGPVFRDLPLGTLTMRQLLTHHSGLANPDDTPPDAHGVPSFYAAPGADRRYCTSKPAAPASAFAYNNCDYILANGVRRGAGWPAGLSMARPREVGIPGFVGGKAEPGFALASWDAAGGLVGTARAVFAFDRSLMTATLVSPAQRAMLWTPEGGGSYQALGQWVFPGTLKGCAAPKRIVQRDGEIYGVQARNFILPDDDLAVIVFTNRSANDFAIGEVWQGRGFAYDLLSAAACA